MQLIYYTELSIFFNIIPEHICAFVPSCHEIINFIMLEIRTVAFLDMCEQPFPLLITVELAPSQELLCRHKKRSNTWDVAISTTGRKWKWLTMNGFVCNNVISAAMEFLNLCQNGWGLCWKIVILKWNRWSAYIVVVIEIFWPKEP